jgi:hypothetical protein
MEALPSQFTEMGVTYAAVTARCDATGPALKHLWYFADSLPHLLAATVVGADALSEAPWTAEPYLHPPSEPDTNPFFAFQSVSERVEANKVGPDALEGPRLNIKTAGASFILNSAAAEPAEFLKNVHKVVTRAGVGRPR